VHLAQPDPLLFCFGEWQILAKDGVGVTMSALGTSDSLKAKINSDLKKEGIKVVNHPTITPSTNRVSRQGASKSIRKVVAVSEARAAGSQIDTQIDKLVMQNWAVFLKFLVSMGDQHALPHKDLKP
jgi:hypothetical protein